MASVNTPDGQPIHNTLHSVPPISTTPQRYHALWLSDIHLGCKDCKAEFLIQLLGNVICDKLFLVGDIIDFWALKNRLHWPDAHHKVLQKIIAIAQTQTQVVFIPGNHDELLKSYHYFNFCNIEIQPEYLHTTISGKKLLMLHGDQFDSQVCISRYYAKLGDHLYDFILFLNRSLHAIRKRFGHSYWSLAGYIKRRVSKAQQAIARYKFAAINHAKAQNVDAIFCGHIHQPELTEESNIIYGNQGDWIENCTLLVETEAGELQLLQWDEAYNNTRVLKSIESPVAQLTPEPTPNKKQPKTPITKVA
ncbi:UDP-2,3-diacylglucosamine diphosphatase [Parashewanella curva]|uniref:UDP-2,3-diacylglucosamine diphosphatase n=1 Tax=Parashewanella curva TaxID=2338552 RepID=A0A3L8PUH9_9GAMM|nr:UDP-2,3-diacylglucosamine diphosphatase [Parashewanella curva]RLV59077.1 UDP-2,3-diacylglucosamine diphosphatase [Parashewanella curva]